MKVEFYVNTHGVLPLPAATAAGVMRLAREKGWTGDGLPPHELCESYEGKPVKVSFEVD